MSEEFDHVSEESYSSFWPLLILIVGFLAWLGIQDFSLNNQRMFYATQFQKAQPAITDAQNIANRYVNLTKDLLQAAQKDPAAAQIVKDAIAGGLFHVNQTASTNSATTPAEPTPDSTSPTSTDATK
jgi:hypothetical protein